MQDEQLIDPSNASNAPSGKQPGKETMLNFCKRICASFPALKITLISLLISGVSIPSMSVTAVLLLLHFIGRAGPERWFYLGAFR
jgi:hypothetical protein